MNSKEILHSHYVIVRFDEAAGSHLTWTGEVDEVSATVTDLGNQELLERGAPLAVMGILALRTLLAEQVIDLALNRADNVRWRDLFRQLQAAGEDEPLQQPALRLVH